MPCADYYDLLNWVRLVGVWEEWLTFFAEGVLETAQNSVETAQRLVRIGVEDTARIQDPGPPGRLLPARFTRSSNVGR